MASIIKFYETGYNPNNLTIQWNLGNVCNYQCEYCPKILHIGNRPWVEIELIKQTLLKIKETFPLKKIRAEFLGGEITLYKDFLNLIKFCSENQINNLVFSNASRSIRYWETILNYLDEIILTFHPQTASKEHFDKLINLLVLKNKKVYVHIAMQDLKFQELIEYGNYLKKNYPSISISMTLMMDKERNKNFNGYFYNYSSTEINSVSKKNYSNESYVLENDELKTTYTLNEIKKLNLNSFKGFTCGEDNNMINIDYFGNATTKLCRQKSSINIYTTDILSLFSPHVCQSDLCTNPADLRIIKIKKQ